jgi:hypothetical protein
MIFDLNFSTFKHQNKVKLIKPSNRYLLDISVWLDLLYQDTRITPFVMSSTYLSCQVELSQPDKRLKKIRFSFLFITFLPFFNLKISLIGQKHIKDAKYTFSDN